MQRERILSAQREGKEQDDFVLPNEEELKTQAAKGKKKAPVLFQALARCIGKRWKALPKDKVEEYETRAKGEMTSYRAKMDEYQQAVVLKSIDESEKLKNSRRKEMEEAQNRQSADKTSGPISDDATAHMMAGGAMNPQFAGMSAYGSSGMPFPAPGFTGFPMMQYPQSAMGTNGFFQTGAMDPTGSFAPGTFGNGMDPSYFGAMPSTMMAAQTGMYQQMQAQIQAQGYPGMANFPQASYMQGQLQSPGMTTSHMPESAPPSTNAVSYAETGGAHQGDPMMGQVPSAMQGHTMQGMLSANMGTSIEQRQKSHEHGLHEKQDEEEDPNNSSSDAGWNGTDESPAPAPDGM